MKKLLALIFVFGAVLYAAPMGKIDSISKILTVKNNYWSCSFINGSMLPGDFVFADGSRAGAIIFRDAAVDGKQEFYLFEERHTERKIIRNTEDEFIAEFSGGYWRNVSPLIKPLPGVKVVCRYEFKRNSPTVKMTFKYDYKDVKNVIFKDFFHIGWYYENPFKTAVIDGKTFELQKGFQRGNAKSVIFKNDKFSVQLSGNNVLAAVPKRKNIIVCYAALKGQTVNNSGKFEKQAVLKLLPL